MCIRDSNWAAGTYVVSSRADPRAIQAALGQTRSITGAGKFLLFAAGAGVLVLAGFCLLYTSTCV